jgi:hypothetical protein
MKKSLLRLSKPRAKLRLKLARKKRRRKMIIGNLRNLKKVK